MSQYRPVTVDDVQERIERFIEKNQHRALTGYLGGDTHHKYIEVNDVFAIDFDNTDKPILLITRDRKSDNYTSINLAIEEYWVDYERSEFYERDAGLREIIGSLDQYDNPSAFTWFDHLYERVIEQVVSLAARIRASTKKRQAQ